MTGVAIKTEKLDDEQEGIEASVNNSAIQMENDARGLLERANTQTMGNYVEGRWRRSVEHNSAKVQRSQKQQKQSQHQQLPLESATLQTTRCNNRFYGKSNLPKSLCGEVFVSNNARQWTFICTFCSKSTRDIGEFICHIKGKHLGGFGPEDGDFDDASSQETCEEQDQNYLDYGSYLDVNVHTEPEEFSNFNGQEAPSAMPYANTSSIFREESQEVENLNKKNQLLLQNQLNAQKHVETIKNDDGKSVHSYNEPENSSKRSSSAIQEKMGTSVSKKLKKTSNNAITTLYTGKSKDSVNGSFDQVPLSFGDIDLTDTRTDQEASTIYEDEDKDFDNQLLITPNESFDFSLASGSEGKAKRRQIRGTAYCGMCDKTFQYYSLYRNHMIKHSNATPFRCTLCDKGFKSKQAIRYHMNTHDKEKQYKCSLCYASYTTENQFITHMFTHEDEKTFPCIVCGALLRSEKERDFHMAGHTEERPFRCEYCHKLFKLRHHLSNHLKLHRQYRCDFCKEEFNSAVYQRKPYSCPKCEKSVDKKQQKNSEGQAGGDINPLQLFETVMTPGHRQHSDYTETVSDVEYDDRTEIIDDDQDQEDRDEDDEDASEYDGEDVEDEQENGKYGTITERKKSTSMSHDSFTEMNPTTRNKCSYKCKFCSNSYTALSSLNHHIRTKHC